MDTDRARRHRAWLEGFGFTPDDWARIKARALATGPGRATPALEDLSRPVRVLACPPEEARRYSGRLLGTFRGRALLCWPMTERERADWSRRRPAVAPRESPSCRTRRPPRD